MVKKFLTTKQISLNEFLRGEITKIPELSEKSSNSKIRRLIVSGCVKVNGKVVTRPGFELRGESEVLCEIDEEKFFYEKQPDDIDFTLTKDDVLFEDEYLICVNKPAFLPVEQTIVGNRKNLHDCVVVYLWKQNPSLRNPPYVGIMHRLDRETSGVILFTKQRSVNKAIFEQFEKHTIQKTYLAVATCGDVHDVQIGERFIVEKPLGRISAKSQAAKWGIVSESKGGQYAKTEFEILGAAPDCLTRFENQSAPNSLFGDEIKSLPKNAIVIQCKPLTGRTHQIRVHLSSVGLPILGDTLYGGEPYSRVMLHAQRLELKNPISGEDIRVETPNMVNIVPLLGPFPS